MADARNEAELREAARARLAGGVLPATAPAHTWGGPGDGSICALCDQPVTRTDIEFEIEFATAAGASTLRFHRECHAVWDAERRPRLESWIAVGQALPPAGVVVEARVRLAEGRTVILDLRREGAADARWTNATSGEPLPGGWVPLEWRWHARPTAQAEDPHSERDASRRA